jgi:hypothetical protein
MQVFPFEAPVFFVFRAKKAVRAQIANQGVNPASLVTVSLIDEVMLPKVDYVGRINGGIRK